MKRTLITFLSFILATPAFAMISGKVYDTEENPARAATVQLFNNNNDPKTSVTTDQNGYFKLDNVYPGDPIIVKHAGQSKKIDHALAENEIKFDAVTLQEFDSQDDVIGTPCCLPDTCTDCDRSEKIQEEDGERCKNLDGIYEKPNGELVCRPKRCLYDTYKPEIISESYYICVLDPAKDRKKNKDVCTPAELKSQNLKNVKSAIVEEWDEKTGVATKCKIHECENSDYTLKDNQCVSKNGKPCTPSNNANVTSATWQNNGGKSLTCLINSCSNNLVPNEDKTACVDSKAVKQAEKNLKAAKQNENSFANKALTGATMATTGIGGMMIGSGLSEQFADDDAYADMRAYIDTFRCEYGFGQIAYGGDTNVDLPGGNKLTDLYVQYTTLANDLKIRKQALNIRPGIESEVIIDKADSGLYNNAGTGITSGGYASTARAILNPGGSDSEKLETQNNNSADKLETGTGLAGAGIVGSILINNSQK